MSLIKSFNMKFLMQSLKKSKGIVIFSLIVVPLLTSLFLITISVESHRNIIVDFSTYELLDYILLYVIPFVFSDILFGYVFKKASTDFIGSMPVNRKTIFVTGTIGGIALITIMQILAVGIIAFLCLLLPSISLVGMPILNFLFMMLISYIFMFVATNLAMTISGTFKTQLIVTILIVFLVPVCFDICKISVNMQRNTYIDSYYYSDYDNYDLKIYDGNRQIKLRQLLKDTSYTMPYNILRYGNYYTNESIIKTVVLGVAYFFLGLKLFQIKKMEDGGQSFGSEKAHIILKGITLIPAMLLINIYQLHEGFGIANIIIIGVIAVYYFLFDYIIKKKIKFVQTIKYFVFTLVIIWLITAGLNAIITNISTDKEIDLDNIKAVSISNGYYDIYNSLFYSYSSSDSKYGLDEKYFIEDDTLKEMLFDAIYEYQNPKNHNSFDPLEMDLYDTDEYYPFGEYSNKYIRVNIKLNSGKTYIFRTEISSSNYEKIVNLITKDQEFSDYYVKKMINSKGKFLSNDTEVFNGIMQSKIKRELKNAKDEIDVSQLINAENDDSCYLITKYAYVDHKLKTYRIPVNITEGLVQLIGDYENSQITKKVNFDRTYLNYLTIYNSKNERAKVSKNNQANSYDYYSYKNQSSTLDFIEEHIDEDFDASKPYYIIDIYVDGGSYFSGNIYREHHFTFFTNQVEEVEKTFLGK